MTDTQTFGRRPTIGEIEAYYAREDVLAFLYEACRLRTVNVSFKGGTLRKGLYRTLQPRGPDHLREILDDIFRNWVEKAYRKRAEKSGTAVAEVRPDMFGFLSFHASAVIGEKGKEKGFDLVLEPDLQGWRRSFEALSGVIRLLDGFEVCYRLKYSGVRSLHLMIPWEALPRQFNGRPLRRRRKWVTKGIREYGKRHLGAESADSPGLLRLAYSLNEDNGLVSVPIAPSRLHHFRPWQAHIHQVSVDQPWHGEVPAGASRKSLRLLREVCSDAEKEERKRTRTFTFGLDVLPRPTVDSEPRENGPETWARQLRSADEAARLAAAWQVMNSGAAVPLPALQAGLDDENADVRWYLTEALQQHPTWEALALAGRMLLDPDQFVRISAGDALVLAAAEGERKGVRVLDVLVDAVASSGGAVSLRGFLDVFIDVVYVIEKVCVGGQQETRGAVLEAGGTTLARLLEHAIDSGQETPGRVQMKRLRTRTHWIRRLRTMCRHHGFEVIAMFRPVIQVCLRKLAQEVGEQEIGLRLYASVLEGIYEDQAAMLAALGEIAGSLGVDGVEVPAVPADPVERSLLRETIREVVTELSPQQQTQVLIRLLRDGGNQVRSPAMEVLQRLGKPAAASAAVFAEMTRNEDAHVRGSSVRALGEMAGPDALPFLLESLKDGNKNVRHSAVLALSQIGPAAVPRLVEALQEGSGSVASHAALALGRIGDPAAVPALIGALADRATCHNATRALGAIGGTEAVRALIEALESEYKGARQGAVNALGQLGDSRAVPALVRLLEDEYPSIRTRAVWALGQLGGTEAVRTVIRALKDENREVRRAALDGLGQLGGTEAARALIEALGDETMRDHAARVLGQTGDPAVVPALIKTLQDENWLVRYAAARALGALGKSASESVAALTNALEDEEEPVRREAAKGLKKIGTPAAPEYLRR